MYDILLNAAKFAVSDDVRKSTAALVDLIRKAPEWQHDICTLDAKVEGDRQEHATLLSGLTEEKLRNLRFPQDAVDSFRTIYAELAHNAFEHGCTPSKSITVSIEISTEYVSVSFLNSKGRKFDLLEALRTSRTQLGQQPDRQRGRGLLLVEELADTVLPIADRGLKAAVLRHRVTTEQTVILDVTVIRLTDGMFNPSLSRRLLSLISSLLKKSNVVLDLSEHSIHVGTVVYRVALSLRALPPQQYRFVLLLAEYTKKTEALFYPESTFAVSTWLDALKELNTSLGYDQLISHVGKPLPKVYAGIEAQIEEDKLAGISKLQIPDD